VVLLETAFGPDSAIVSHGGTKMSTLSAAKFKALGSGKRLFVGDGLFL